ncbi:hypothetical protein QP794_01605 [Paenibacillus sp. UMB7766-LJ446]|uniref:hypothetical protein n=1 Tax=Paenibacillus sp. UMB7766-LJ446 TaxID=3046313 RepID=UPI00255131BD|nr:hypothetical protein [Paenibacillus sp. UMB7766-LJ446]MDK8188777.1 hypothetical protein [Paenibacillus sp. UMB7766-LJ446]
MSEVEQVVEGQEEKTLDQTLNIGSTVRLAEGIKKTIKVGTIKLIREVRQQAKNLKGIRFSYVIGRDAIEATQVGEQDIPAIDCPAIEQAYKKAFDMIFVEGLTDEEYEQVDMEGIKSLDDVLDRFL